MSEHSAFATFLFTDIEGSTRLWDEQPERMKSALARHDAIARDAVESHGGHVVKMTGDGVHAVFADPLDAIQAVLQMQFALTEPQPANGLQLRARCGLHAGISERRDNDYFGTVVNRAARIMGSAHGGQVLLSDAVATLVGEHHPAGFALRDLGRVRLRDLASPERVYQLLHPKLRAEFPPLRSLEATPNNLPQQVTSFVGRDRELAQARDLLTRGRLLTLLGVGGLGKSRLSLQIAAEMLDAFPDGVWLVELASIADERLVPLSVASALGVKEESGHPVQEALVRYVADRQLLIILDNCEHLIGACAHLAKALLQSGAHVRILATSREALRIAGETTLQLPTLSVPDPDAVPALSDLREIDAIRLFLDRATAADPGFHLDEHNAAATTEICRRLDGIPLAIELAAARVRVLPVDRIAARLNDRFKLLTEGDRTALKRQQTLRALIDWSHDLLTPVERALFRRLSVFAGGWTLDAAEAVATGADVDETDVLDPLTRLVEKSLVAPDADGSRFRFLETIREYADEQLRDSGEEGDVRMRHLQWYLALFEAGRPHLIGPEQATWLARLDTERENLFAAHRYCDSAPGGGELGMRLMSAVRRYWFDRGLLGLGYRTTMEALARPSAQAPTPARAAALNDAGQIAAFMGRYAEAHAHLVASLAVTRTLGDRRRIGYLLQPLALACMGIGDLAAAREYLDEALTIARESGDTREIAAVLSSLAQIARMEGDLETAEPLYREVLEIGRDTPDIASFTLLNLAMVAILRGSSERAREMLLEVIAICDELDLKTTGQSVMEVTSGLAAACGDWEHAARFFGAAERQSAVSGMHRDPTDEAFLLPLIKKARAALDSSTYIAAETAGRALDYASAMTAVRTWLAAAAT
ncbi:MAG TPA: tetratricopeptide repeat protein [Casimicrobiaceae bacterium]|nr:tetratricopeptide repeat protein [Casimicrobiaceae bacterium]